MVTRETVAAPGAPGARAAFERRAPTLVALAAAAGLALALLVSGGPLGAQLVPLSDALPPV